MNNLLCASRLLLQASSLLLSYLLIASNEAQPAFTELGSPDPRRGEGFGDSFGGLPDLTGDGVGEFFVFGWFGTYILNGKTLDPLYKIEEACNNTGFSTHSAGDVNGDGTPDLMVAELNCNNQTGSLLVLDGPTGALLETVESPDPVRNGSFGATLRLLPDMTGDGKPDWLIHQPEPELRAGRVYIFDSHTAQPVRTLMNSEPSYKFPMEQVEVIPDVDGDGKPDMVVGSWHATVQRDGETVNSAAARVIVRSLTTGDVLYELKDPDRLGRAAVGLALAPAGDVNRDGIGDIAVGAPWKDNFAGAIHLFSGADGRWLRKISSPRPRPDPTNGGGFGRRVEPLPDITGDGIPELWTQEDGGSMPLWTYVHDGASGRVLRAIKYPGDAVNPFGGPRFFIGTISQAEPPGIHAYLFGLGHIASGAGRVYVMPFTPLPKGPQLKAVRASEASFRLVLTGEFGASVQVQASSDLKSWERLNSVTLGAEGAAWDDPAAGKSGRRYYRAVVPLP